MRNFRALVFLFLANSISGFATGITFLGIPWNLVSRFGEEGGNQTLAWMMTGVTMATLFWGPYAGTIVDRYNRKNIFRGLTATNGLVLLGISAIGYFSGGLSIPWMVVAMTVTVFNFNLHYPTLYAFVQELFEPKYYRKVNSAIELQGQVTNFMGMAAAAILLDGSEGLSWWPDIFPTTEAWSLWEILRMDGITYLASFSLISFIRYKPDPNRRVDKGSLSDRIKQGFNYLANNKPLFIFGISSYSVFITLLIVIQVILPIYVNDYLGFGKGEGGSVIAKFEMFYSGGAILMGLLTFVMGSLLSKINVIKTITFLVFLATLVYLTYGFTRSEQVFVFGAGVMGLANSGIRIFRITYIIRIVPNYIVGRVNSFFMVVRVMIQTLLTGMLGLPFFTGMGNGDNINIAMVVFGAITFIASLILLFRFRTFNHKAAYG